MSYQVVTPDYLNKICKQSSVIKCVIVSITKFSLLIGYPRAYLARYVARSRARSITGVRLLTATEIVIGYL